MTEANCKTYPSVREQAIEVSNSLHDELHLIIDQIRNDVSPEASTLVYIDLIRQAKAYWRNLTGIVT